MLHYYRPVTFPPGIIQVLNGRTAFYNTVLRGFNLDKQHLHMRYYNRLSSTNLASCRTGCRAPAEGLPDHMKRISQSESTWKMLMC